jgi:O-antigen/teichoic acid export membrane protein
MRLIENLWLLIKKQIFKPRGSVFLFKFFGMFLNFIVTLIITNIFGGSSYGLFSLSLTINQLLVMCFSLGIPSAFIAFTGTFDSPTQNKGLLIKAIKLSFFTTIVPCVLLFLLSQDIAEMYGKINLELFLKSVFLFFFFSIIHEININYFLSIKSFLKYGLFYFVFPNLFFLLLLLLFKYLNYEQHYIMIAYNLSIVLNVILALFLIFRKGKYEVVQIKSRKILNKSLPMMISGFFIMLLSWTDILIMGKYETEENIGIYNAAFKVGTLALFVINATGVIILSDISKHYNDKNFLRLKKIINKTTQITILLTLPIVLFIFFFGKEMLSLFGNDFKKGYLALIIIATGAFFNSITGNVDQILNMTGNEQKVIRVMFVGFVLNILLNFMLIPNYGYVGAAFASFVVNIVVNTIFVIVIRKKLGFYTFI